MYGILLPIDSFNAMLTRYYERRLSPGRLTADILLFRMGTGFSFVQLSSCRLVTTSFVTKVANFGQLKTDFGGTQENILSRKQVP